MAFSVSAISKNTFVTLVADDVEPECEGRPRSRTFDITEMSAPIFRTQAAELQDIREEPQDVTEQSLQRLTTAFMSSGSSQFSASRSDSPVGSLTTELSLPTIPESALTSAPQRPWDQKRRVHSSCSLSTMATDDAPSRQSSSSDAPVFTKLPIRKAWSSGSIASMVSWADVTEEEEGCEFELDIEVGANAAQKKEAVEPLSPLSPKSKGKVTHDMTHSSVPKSHNMEEIAKSAEDAPPTTLMIRNIPGKYAQTDLMADLNETGFGGTYDFLYLPIDKGTSNNVGYAFVNFNNPAVAAQCIVSFSGHRFAKLHRSSNKTAKISVAHLQGLEKNLAHYEKTAVNMSKQQQRRPVFLASPLRPPGFFMEEVA